MDDPTDLPQPWWREIADRERREIEPEEDQAILAALGGLMEGNLAPLAAFLKAGYPLNYMLRREIVDAINGKDGKLFKLELKKTRRGRGTTLGALRTRARNHEIGAYIADQMARHSGGVDAAVKAAEAQFSIKPSVAYKAWAYYSKLRIKGSYPLDE